jgi:hypothetical protein
MNKIVLNETHIRQLIEETVKKLILGEDDIDYNLINESDLINLLKNSKYDGVIDQDFNGINTGKISVIFKTNHPEIEYIDITAYFDVDIRLGQYDPGDYYTPPSQDCDIDMNITEIIYNIDDEQEGVLNNCPPNILAKLEELINDLIENNIDYDDLEDYYGPDPDEKYDSWRNGDYND